MTPDGLVVFVENLMVSFEDYRKSLSCVVLSTIALPMACMETF